MTFNPGEKWMVCCETSAKSFNAVFASAFVLESSWERIIFFGLVVLFALLAYVLLPLRRAEGEDEDEDDEKRAEEEGEVVFRPLKKPLTGYRICIIIFSSLLLFFEEETCTQRRSLFIYI